MRKPEAVHSNFTKTDTCILDSTNVLNTWGESQVSTAFQKIKAVGGLFGRILTESRLFSLGNQNPHLFPIAYLVSQDFSALMPHSPLVK